MDTTSAEYKEALRERWQQLGYSYEEWQDEPEQVWNDLSDPRDELVHVLSGTLEVFLEGRESVVLHPGEDVLIPANVIHGSRVLSSQPVQLVFGYRTTS